MDFELQISLIAIGFGIAAVLWAKWIARDLNSVCKGKKRSAK